MNNRPIDDVLNEGMRLMKKIDLSNEMVEIWARYSLDIINLISRNNFLKYQYSSVVADAMLSNDTPNKKLDDCLRFLISNYSII